MLLEDKCIEILQPLIMMTPKSLLRNKYCVSNLEDFSKSNTFHRILWDHALDPQTKGFIKLKESSKIKKSFYVQEKFISIC